MSLAIYVLVLINGYDGNARRVMENAEFVRELLRKYAGSDGGSVLKVRVKSDE